MGFLTAGHSHAGLLSFELALDGKSVIVDPGTYSYRMSNPWRDHFRRMEAHNVVQIDGQDWYMPGGPFRWERMDTVQPIRSGAWYDHDLKIGYQTRDATGKKIQHVRSFAAESSRALSVHDHFEGTGKHRLTFWLHFVPGSRLRHQDGCVFEIEFCDTAVVLVLEGFGDFQWEVWESSDNPPAGWVSPGFDQKVAAPTLCIEDEAEMPADRRISVRIVSGSQPEVPRGETASLEKLR